MYSLLQLVVHSNCKRERTNVITCLGLPRSQANVPFYLCLGLTPLNEFIWVVKKGRGKESWGKLRESIKKQEWQRKPVSHSYSMGLRQWVGWFTLWKAVKSICCWFLCWTLLRPGYIILNISCSVIFSLLMTFKIRGFWLGSSEKAMEISKLLCFCLW